MEFLQSGILDSGTKFMISNKVKNPHYIPGSVGFVSHLGGLDDSYQNVISMTIVITRKGKSGKERLDLSRIKVPIFTFDSDNFAKIMPTIENRRDFVYIDKQETQYNNLMEVSSLDFLGWAAAVSKKLRIMSSMCKHSKWPSSNKNPVNRMFRLPEFFSEDPADKSELYGNAEFRSLFLNEARNMYSSMIKIHLELDEQKVKCEINASEFLEFTNKGKFLEKKNAKNEYKLTDDNALLERTTKYYESIKKDINKLRAAKNNKR